MTKVEKAIAKLYFALGESGAALPAEPDIPGFALEYIACRALRAAGAQVANRYFAMGSASASRNAAKSPKGGSKAFRRTGKAEPLAGKSRKAPKPAKASRGRSGWDDDDFDFGEDD